jgi:hypothetical protein
MGTSAGSNVNTSFSPLVFARSFTESASASASASVPEYPYPRQYRGVHATATSRRCPPPNEPTKTHPPPRTPPHPALPSVLPHLTHTLLRLTTLLALVAYLVLFNLEISFLEDPALAVNTGGVAGAGAGGGVSMMGADGVLCMSEWEERVVSVVGVCVAVSVFWYWFSAVWVWMWVYAHSRYNEHSKI